MIECQSCGDKNGPWVYVEGIGCLCEDCYGYKEVCDKMVTLIKHHKKCQSKNSLDIVAFVESIENSVYDELGLQ